MRFCYWWAWIRILDTTGVWIIMLDTAWVSPAGSTGVMCFSGLCAVVLCGVFGWCGVRCCPEPWVWDVILIKEYNRYCGSNPLSRRGIKCQFNYLFLLGINMSLTIWSLIDNVVLNNALACSRQGLGPRSCTVGRPMQRSQRGVVRVEFPPPRGWVSCL